MDTNNHIPWIYSKQKNNTNGYGYGNGKHYQSGSGRNYNKRSSNNNNHHHHNNNYYNYNQNNQNQYNNHNQNQTQNYNYKQPKHIEFNLSSISIEEYHESIDSTVDDYKLRFRYKYLEEGISIFLNDNRCKIYIPVDNLEAISKIQSNVIVLTLKKDLDPASSVNYSSKEGYLKDDPIRDNLYKATSISMIVQESTPQQVIDMAGLHIHYLTNRNNKGKTKAHISNWGGSNSILFSPMMKDEELLLKCHVGADIRILRFNQPIKYDDIKKKLQAALEIAEISKLKYKDEENEFITIINNADFDTAFKLYKKENKLEIWIVEKLKGFGK